MEQTNCWPINNFFSQYSLAYIVVMSDSLVAMRLSILLV